MILNKIKRHAVTILRPSTTVDSRGQLSGSATTVVSDVPCSIEQLSGRELELARQRMANATLRVRMFSDPAWRLTTGDYLVRLTDTFTAVSATDICTSTSAHGLRDGDIIVLSTTGTLPAGLSIATRYFARDTTTTTFKLAATRDGTAIDITDTGTGTHTWYGRRIDIGYIQDPEETDLEKILTCAEEADSL